MQETSLQVDGLEQLLSLEEKINQTIELLKTTRAEKMDMAEENARFRASLDGQNKAIQLLEGRLNRLEKERETVRGRVQKLLRQVESLTREQSGA